MYSTGVVAVDTAKDEVLPLRSSLLLPRLFLLPQWSMAAIDTYRADLDSGTRVLGGALLLTLSKSGSEEARLVAPVVRTEVVRDADVVPVEWDAVAAAA